MFTQIDTRIVLPEISGEFLHEPLGNIPYERDWAARAAAAVIGGRSMMWDGEDRPSPTSFEESLAKYNAQPKRERKVCLPQKGTLMKIVGVLSGVDTYGSSGNRLR